MDLFGNLPRDIAINILSRLPIRSMIECKAVCKEWRDMINCREFCNQQRRRHLIVFPQTRTSPWPDRISPSPYKIEELNNNPNPTGMAIIHMDLFESVPLVRRSVDGLILLMRREWEQEHEQERHQHVSLWVCNPITREYVGIPHPSDRDFGLGLPDPPKYYVNRHQLHPQPYTSETVPGYNFGFGVSRSKQYKVVWISQSECRVYTLGTTRRWRTITVSRPGLLRYNKWNTECDSVGGKLYWLDPPDSQTLTEISCFDLETEVFTYLSAPPPRHKCNRSLCVLDDCLCLCDVHFHEIEIWLMRGEGDWSKKGVISVQRIGRRGYLFPIQVLEDDRNGNGMLLGTRCYHTIRYCSSNNNNNNNGGGGGEAGKRIICLYPKCKQILKTTQDYPRAAIYTPSFLSLKTLMDEDVRSF